MSDTIHLEIVTPDKKVLDEDVKTVIAPGTIGEFGVLTGHTPFMTSLQVGSVRYIDTNGKEAKIFISGGFAETLPSTVTILAEAAEMQENIDIDRAKSALDRAQNRINNEESDDIDFLRAKLSLERALNRIKIVEG